MHARRLTLGLTILSLLLAAPFARATTVVQPTFDNLVGSSDYIVRAVVKSVDSEWRVNPKKANDAYIGSKVTLDVREVIKGNPPNPLVLDMVGGRVGEDELHIDGTPRFVVGQESILFVHGNGTNFFPLTGLMHGFFPIKHDAATGRDEVMRYNGRALYSEKELEPSAIPLAARSTLDRPLTPQTFSVRIRQRQSVLTTRVPQN